MLDQQVVAELSKFLVVYQGYDGPCCTCDGLSAGSGEMGRRFQEQKDMTNRHHTKLVHEGDYVAEVDVELINSDTGWAPYLSVDDACRIDDVREALRRGDIKAASGLARVFALTPVAV